MFHVPEKYRFYQYGHAYSSTRADGNNGAFYVPKKNVILKCIASDGNGWEHVSVSLPNRCPNWPEMCYIKSLFWDSQDCVIQYHPPESDYVNLHKHCLHLWRPIDIDIPAPPNYMV